MGAGSRTVGRVMSRTVIWLVVGGAIVIAAGLGVAWQVRMNEQAVLDRVTKPTAAVPQPAPSTASSAPAPAAPPPAATATPSPVPPAVAVPTFDIARIGPDGRAVVAGRANPGAKIVLLDGGKEIARSEADARGEWVVIVQDPPLTSGQHELRVVQHIEGRAPVTSEQVVVAVVPEPPAAAAAQPSGPGGQPPREETLVMIAPPGGGPAKLVQAPSASGVPRSGDLAVSTLDYDETGQVTVTGLATPGVVVRVYINDNLVAEGAAGAGSSRRPIRSAPASTRCASIGWRATASRWRGSSCRSIASSWRPVPRTAGA